MSGKYPNRNPGDRGGQRPGGRGPEEPRQNEALARFQLLIKNQRFTDDEVMRLTDDLGKSLAFNPQGRGEREGKENTRTQVRKFYNLVRVTNTSASSPEKTETVKLRLRMLQAQVAYAVARKTISPDFKKFFDTSLDKIINSGDLKGTLDDFAKFFEALYAYFYFHSEVRR